MAVDDRELYLISMAAEILQMHPQTLRKYERLGLVRPSRAFGSMRVYSDAEIDRLRLIKTLVDEAGINLAGVQRLLSIAEVVTRMRPALTELPEHVRRELAEISRDVDEIFKLVGLETRSRKG